MNSNEYLLWNEKYKPLKMDDILGQDDVLISIKKMINNGSLPAELLGYAKGGKGHGHHKSKHHERHARSA